MASRRLCTITAALALALAGTAGAQAVKPAVQSHIDAARKAAGQDFQVAFWQCDTAVPAGQAPVHPSLDDVRASGGVKGRPAEPAKVFDNLYFVGVRTVSAWAIDTPAGIILIDTLDNSREAEDAIDGGLRKLGLDPARIKYIVITHQHGDHYGGARWLVDKYHPKVLASDIDWKGMAGQAKPANPKFDPPPERGLTIRDGQKLSLGGETLTFYITPGHTPGTVSVLFPVTDRGKRHVAALLGGTGLTAPRTAEHFAQYAQSVDRYAKLAMAAGADIPLSNHPENDSALFKIDALKQRGDDGRNPFVMGKDGVRRVLTTLSECAKANQAAVGG